MMKQLEKLKITCQAKNFSDRTTGNYLRPCRLFFEWLNKEKKEINRDAIYEYHAKLKTYGYDTSTIKLHACAIRFYLRTVLNREDLVSSMPTIKQISKIPIVLAKEEVKLLINMAGNPIHETILLVLYTCGLRLSELLNIRMSDIDYYRKNILIHGKGRKERFVPILDDVISKIKTHFSKLKPFDFLCTTINGERKMSSRTIGMIVEKCAKKAGINKRVYPHLLRHSFATHCIESGIDIRYVQLVLGHTSILATAQYSHVASIPELKNIDNLSYLFK